MGSLFAVTGATGYLGARMCTMLRAQGHRVRAVVRNPVKATFLEAAGVDVVRSELTDLDGLSKAFAGVDGLIHSAAYAKVWAKDPATYFDVNVLGVRTVLEAARLAHVPSTVVTSSVGTWGPSIKGAIDETRTRDIDFLNEYESSKALGDQEVLAAALRGQRVCLVSPTRIYGPSPVMSDGSVTGLIDRYVHRGWRIIPGSGRQVGNYVYVDDVAYGHLLAWKDGEPGRDYILHGDNASYDQFFAEVARASGIRRRMIHLPLGIQRGFTHLQLWRAERFGREPLLTPSWMGKSLYNWEIQTTRARDELGYSPRTLGEGIDSTVRAFLS